ncbi:hypothetical protein N0V88_003629 [Collariella sp. IMI 366227]|nr:hypothetical protein N0V88_003629 [Collariella sp. IMI 366227]
MSSTALLPCVLRYAVKIQAVARPLPHEPIYIFASHADCLTAATQSVVQDVLYIVQDVARIRKRKVECAFLKVIPDSQGATADSFVVLVWHHLDLQKGRLGKTLTRLLKGDDDNKTWAARQLALDMWRHTGCDFAMSIRRPHRVHDLALVARDQPIKAFNKLDRGYLYLEFENGEAALKRVKRANDAMMAACNFSKDSKAAKAEYRHFLMDSFKRDLLTGSGLPILLYPPLPFELHSAGNAAVDEVNECMKNLCLAQTPRSLPFVNIFEGVPNRVLRLIEKMIDHETYGRFFSICRRHATRNLHHHRVRWPRHITHVSLVAILFPVCPKIGGALYCAAPNHEVTSSFADRLLLCGTNISATTGCPVSLVICGCPIDEDIDAFEASITANPIYTPLRQFLLGVAVPFGCAEKPPQNPEELPPWRAARNLMVKIIMQADTVSITPHVAGDNQSPYFTHSSERAKAVVLDKAGMMHVADALQVWGPGCHPCVLGGDGQQVPAIIMGRELRKGLAVKMFYEQARLSVFAKLERISLDRFVGAGVEGGSGAELEDLSVLMGGKGKWL